MWESHCETKHKKRVSRGFSVHSSENTIWHHKTASLWNIWASKVSCLFRFSFSVCNCCRMTYLNEIRLLFLSFFWHLLIIDEKIEVCVKYSSAQLKTGNSWAGFVQNRPIGTSENLIFKVCYFPDSLFFCCCRQHLCKAKRTNCSSRIILKRLTRER